MKRRIFVAAALAVTLGAAACGSSKTTSSSSNDLNGKGKTIKVWLMVDAQSGWKEVVDDATARFKAATGAEVNVEYQQWANHLTKLDATLAGSDVPDVVELGNTEHAEVRLQRRVRRPERQEERLRELSYLAHRPVRAGDLGRQDSTACPTTPAPGC